jgi:hypothetical protein
LARVIFSPIPYSEIQPKISNILGSKLFSIDSNEALSLLGIYPETFRRPHNGGNNILITGTTAKIPAQVLAYLRFGGRRILVEQLIDGQQETWRTKATLKTRRLQESLLNRMQWLAIFRQSRQPFDGQDSCTVCLHGEEETRPDGLAVEENGAAAADSLLAAQMSTGEPKMVAQEISQRQTRLHKSFTLFAVDRQRYGKLCNHLVSFQSFKPFKQFKWFESNPDS